ncbi:LysR substrate-binding domain-containing protein [Paracoccus sp. JM45]|uniref:LysR substrate-binding domain-containing protein n=1 Tax=Paracoccus sp. JM45 TaxID=2283626 RepID=UPI001603C38B|nr:LysR substrate-binding domain-containing protein [Paracoccus sp. JM45]
MKRFLPSHSALRAFEAAAFYMNFTKAAKELGISQSGISRQISTLEARLGTKLFERVGSRLILTGSARTYLAEVRKGFDIIEQATISCVRGGTLDDALTVCSHPTFAARWLTPRMGTYMQRGANRLVNFITTTQDIDFTDTEIDIAILRGRGSWTGARAFELFPEELVVVCAPDIAVRVSNDATVDFDTMPTLQNASRPDLWLTWLRGAGREHRGAIRGPRFPQSEMLVSAACAGIGLAVVPFPYVAKEIRNGKLVQVMGAPVRTDDSYWLVQPETRANIHGARDFIRWIQQEARGFRRSMRSFDQLSQHPPL